MAYWRYKSPGPGRYLYSIRNGCGEYRRRWKTDLPWLILINQASGLIRLDGSHPLVRDYVKSFLHIKGKISPSLWFDINESNRFLSYIESLKRGSFPTAYKEYADSWPMGQEREYTVPSESMSNTPIGENIHLTGGNNSISHALKTVRGVFFSIPEEYRRNMKIPSWYAKVYGIQPLLLRVASRSLTPRQRVLSHIARIHYIVYHVVNQRIFPSGYSNNTSSRIRQSHADCTSHLLLQASRARRHWHSAAEKLLRRLKVLLCPLWGPRIFPRLP